MGEKRWYSPVFNKEKGRYKKGRRSRSFTKRRAAAGVVEEAAPKREVKDNHMRWRKSYERPRPLEKPKEGPKSFKRKEGAFKPRRKSVGGPKPWRKSGKRPRRPRQSRIQSRRKPGGYAA